MRNRSDLPAELSSLLTPFAQRRARVAAVCAALGALPAGCADEGILSVHVSISDTSVSQDRSSPEFQEIVEETMDEVVDILQLNG